jgi:hypothetical protein
MCSSALRQYNNFSFCPSQKTWPVEERSPPRYYIKKSSTGTQPTKVTKVGPLIHGDAAPYGSGLNLCFEAQPTTNPLHEGPRTIGRFTHADQGNQRATFFQSQPEIRSHGESNLGPKECY